MHAYVSTFNKFNTEREYYSHTYDHDIVLHSASFHILRKG